MTQRNLLYSALCLFCLCLVAGTVQGEPLTTEEYVQNAAERIPQHSEIGQSANTRAAAPRPPRSNTLWVDDDQEQCRKAPFTSIQAAIEAARPGDKINVCPGVYREQLKISKPLSIQGVEVAGQHSALISPERLVANTSSTKTGNPLAAAILVVGTTRVQLAHLTVEATGKGLPDCSVSPVGVYYRNASGAITDVEVRNVQLDDWLYGCQAGFGIFVQSAKGARSEVDILQTTVHDYQKNGILASEPGTEVYISGNAVSGIGPTPLIGQNGIQVSFGAKASIEHNAVSDHIYSLCTKIADCRYAAANILVYQADAVVVADNSVSNAQLNIHYRGNRGNIQNNLIWKSRALDGIGVIGDQNRVRDNVIKNSATEGIYVWGKRNEVTENTISAAPFGVFQDTRGASNSVARNVFDNVGLTLAFGVRNLAPLAATDGSEGTELQHGQPSVADP